jgi:iron complex outermembrane receptor protein
VPHKRTDNNWSASALLSYAPTSGVAIELGYAHKARSPNIYERYTWGRRHHGEPDDRLVW